MVMYAASMDALMRYEYAQIYLWAETNANAFHYKKPVEYFWEKLDGHVVHDEDVLVPSGRFYHQYRDISAEVRCKVVAQQMNRERGAKRKITARIQTRVRIHLRSSWICFE